MTPVYKRKEGERILQHLPQDTYVITLEINGRMLSSEKLAATIDELATYKLTESFYKYLHSGSPGDVAMQKAKLELLSLSDHEHMLPYYWSPAILIGQTETIVERSFLWNYWGYAFVTVVAMLSIIFIRRKRHNTISLLRHFRH